MIRTILSILKRIENKRIANVLLKSLSDVTLKKETVRDMHKRIEIPNWNSAEKEQAFNAMVEIYSAAIIRRTIREM